MAAAETINAKWKWPHQVTITKPAKNLVWAEMWLEDHCGSIGDRWNVFAYGHHSAIYYFSSEVDAIEFALIWK